MFIFINLALIFFSTLSFINKSDALICRQCKEHHHENYEGYLKPVHDGLIKLGIKNHDVFCSEKNQNDLGEEKTCKKDEKFCILGRDSNRMRCENSGCQLIFLQLVPII